MQGKNRGMEMSLFLYGFLRKLRENQQQKIQAILEISGGGGGGGIIFHGLEYLIRHEVVFCFIF